MQWRACGRASRRSKAIGVAALTRRCRTRRCTGGAAPRRCPSSARPSCEAKRNAFSRSIASVPGVGHVERVARQVARRVARVLLEHVLLEVAELLEQLRRSLEQALLEVLEVLLRQRWHARLLPARSCRGRRAARRHGGERRTRWRLAGGLGRGGLGRRLGAALWHRLRGRFAARASRRPSPAPAWPAAWARRAWRRLGRGLRRRRLGDRLAAAFGRLAGHGGRRLGGGHALRGRRSGASLGSPLRGRGMVQVLRLAISRHRYRQRYPRGSVLEAAFGASSRRRRSRRHQPVEHRRRAPRDRQDLRDVHRSRPSGRQRSVTTLNASTRCPPCTATRFSGTSDMPTTSAPIRAGSGTRRRSRGSGPPPRRTRPRCSGIPQLERHRLGEARSAPRSYGSLMSGKRGPSVVVVRADERVVAHQVDVVGDDHDVAAPACSGFMPPHRVGHDQRVRTRAPCITRTGNVTCCIV